MSESEIVPVLVRIGDNVKKHKLFKLNREQITIGRSQDVTYCIMSNMISRCHAIIRQERSSDSNEISWNITDNKSLNGIYINGRQLTPSQQFTLNDGDMIQFGVPTAPDLPAEFVYKFYAALKVRVEKKNKKQKTCDETVNTERQSLSSSEEDREKKRKTALSKPKPDLQTMEVLRQQEETAKELQRQLEAAAQQEEAAKEMRKQMEVSQQEQTAREAEYQAKLAAMERLLQEKEQKQNEVQLQLELERQEKENQAKEVEELRLKEAAILLEMEDKQKQLEDEKEELRLKMQAELEANLKEREATLLTQLAAQKDSLLNEKKQVEESLQKEVEKAIEEKNKELEQQLLEQKEKLEKILEKKAMEQKLLESQLNETKEESEKSKTKALKAKEEVLSNFVDLMEMELQCTICNELFVKATSLNCAHVFCKLCISQWQNVKKECPNCRQPITSQMQSIALDSYIDKMVEQLNDELKDRRKELVKQRKVEQEKFDVLEAGPSVAPAPHPVIAIIGADPAVAAVGRGRGRNRGNTRNQRGGRRRGGAAASDRLGTAVAAAATAAANAQQVAETAAANAQRVAAANVQRTATVAIRALATAAVRIPQTAPSNLTRVLNIARAGVPISTVQSIGATASSTSGITSLTSSTTTTTTTSGSSSVLIVSDEEDSNNNASSSDESDSVEGDEGIYYGGYGRCFNCGSRGHWANGCPF